MKSNVLMVEDSLSLAAIYTGYLKCIEAEVHHVASFADAESYLKNHMPDLLLLDIELPDGNGMDLLRQVIEQDVGCDVIVMTAHGTVDMAGCAIRLGAFDFLTKPFDANRLKVTVTNALEHRCLTRKVKTFADLERDRYGDFVGQSLPMQTVYRIIESVAASDATAFIVGESGTGKELAAQAIHQKSNRANHTFHAINCGAIPADLMESELFGHVKGAFTGATASRDGAATIADGGTLFLDEVCEMDLELQKKLLRFLQSGEFQKVGSNKIERVDVRFVCATNKSPLEEVREGRFREDLYYRLHVVPLNMPPLREREDDVLLLAKKFLKMYSDQAHKNFVSFHKDVELFLRKYEWPGNVRELQNIIQNIVVLNNSDVVTTLMLPEQLFEQEPEALETSERKSLASVENLEIRIEPLWLTEKRSIEFAIEACDGNINRASALLEVAPSTIYRKMQTWKSVS